MKVSQSKNHIVNSLVNSDLHHNSEFLCMQIAAEFYKKYLAVGNNNQIAWKPLI